MLEEYFLLVRRISGLSLSPAEYWELDTFTTQKLLDMVKEVIKAEENASKGNNKKKYTEHHEDNAPEMESIISQMQEE